MILISYQVKPSQELRDDIRPPSSLLRQEPSPIPLQIAWAVAKSLLWSGRMLHLALFQWLPGFPYRALRRPPLLRFVYRRKSRLFLKYIYPSLFYIFADWGVLLQIPVFILLIIGYKIKRHGFRISQWGPERSNDLRNTVQVTSKKRKGRLEFPERGLSEENLKTFVNWVWVWMK